MSVWLSLLQAPAGFWGTFWKTGLRGRTLLILFGGFKFLQGGSSFLEAPSLLSWWFSCGAKSFSPESILGGPFKIHFAPPKKPWNDDSRVNTNAQWFSMVAKWCRISSIHSISVCFCKIHVVLLSFCRLGTLVGALFSLKGQHLFPGTITHPRF